MCLAVTANVLKTSISAGYTTVGAGEVVFAGSSNSGGHELLEGKRAASERKKRGSSRTQKDAAR